MLDLVSSVRMLIASPRGFEAPPVLLAWLAGSIDSRIPYFAVDARDNWEVRGTCPTATPYSGAVLRTSAMALN